MVFFPKVCFFRIIFRIRLRQDGNSQDWFVNKIVGEWLVNGWQLLGEINMNRTCTETFGKPRLANGWPLVGKTAGRLWKKSTLEKQILQTNRLRKNDFGCFFSY